MLNPLIIIMNRINHIHCFHSYSCDFHTRNEHTRKIQIPFEISPFSLSPPHRDRVTSGRSLAESDRHSVPLSAAALPTDCGECEPECIPESIQCLEPESESLQIHIKHQGYLTPDKLVMNCSKYRNLILKAIYCRSDV